ncbi:hypothetical protein MMC18_004429 [Xylographa bjoerkii]|nr:hypothetical protein [Xylographa bjoerkii]
MDVNGGTSTGGLIAIMLGRLGMDVTECIEKYTSMFADIFGEKAHHVKVGWSGDINSLFESDALKTAITKVVTDSYARNNLDGAVTNAAKEGSIPILEKLLALDPRLLNPRDDDAQTPLSLAAQWGHIETP